MKEIVNIYFDGIPYTVPSGLTILAAMEYSGFQLKKGLSCRQGICGACSSVYRIIGESEAVFCLACQTTVEEGMSIASLPTYPVAKRAYDINNLSPTAETMVNIFPEISDCIIHTSDGQRECESCTKSCPKDLKVMDYVAAAREGDLLKAADLSFDCVACGICSTRCPANISHSQVGLLARRLVGKYIAKESQHAKNMAFKIENGEYESILNEITLKNISEVQEMYNSREIET